MLVWAWVFFQAYRNGLFTEAFLKAEEKRFHFFSGILSKVLREEEKVRLYGSASKIISRPLILSLIFHWEEPVFLVLTNQRILVLSLYPSERRSCLVSGRRRNDPHMGIHHANDHGLGGLDRKYHRCLLCGQVKGASAPCPPPVFSGAEKHSVSPTPP